jgi:RNA polymerase sigma-70 factor, ECF subfamily
MHDTFLQLMRHEESLRAEPSARLLYRIATNVCLNRIRSDRRHPETSDDELLHRIAAADDLEGTTAARRALARLFGGEPASSRTIAVLHLHDGLTLEEVADLVGLSVSAVRKRLRKLRAALGGEA